MAPLSHAELCAVMQNDARVLGLMADPVIGRMFRTFSAARNGSTKYDVVQEPAEGGCRPWEVKTGILRKAAIDITPSGCKGAGREYDPARHDARVRAMYGYIVVDGSDFPNIQFVGIPSNRLLSPLVRKISRKDFEHYCEKEGGVLS
jgi:hypothetical protein